MLLKRNFALTLLTLIPLTGCIYSLPVDCENTVINAATSPDGKWQAIVFDRGCGATTGFSTQVSVVPSKTSLPEEAGNVFTCDDDHGKAPSGVNGGPDVTVHWLDSKQLKIGYDVRTRVFSRETRYEEVAVVYEAK